MKIDRSQSRPTVASESTGGEARATNTDHGVTSPDPVVRVHQLTKEFGTTRALDHVDLEVAKGELVVLVGLSGSGKSTLLRHLNGLHQPTRGSVQVFGTSVDGAGNRELRQLRQRVGFVFQQFNLVGRSTCIENVLSGALGRVRGPRVGVLTYPKALRREAISHLERVGLADRAFQRADTLSGGQQQRVAIARTLMQQPELVLADEPVASLDPESSAQIMDVLFRICVEDRLTVVCSLHQVELALGWAHRLVGLRDGEKVLDRRAVHLDEQDVMDVYRRVQSHRTELDPLSPEARAADRRAAGLGRVRPEQSPVGASQR